MAGYDFEFDVPIGFADATTGWLSFFRRCTAHQHLEVRWKSFLKSTNRRWYYVQVDGPLPQMQHVERQLPNQAFGYINATRDPGRFVRYVLAPFSIANARGLRNITSLVFDVADELDRRLAGGAKSLGPRLALAPTLLKVTKTRSRRPGAHAIASIVRALDGLATGSLTSANAIILSDQAMEEWLKDNIGLKKSKLGLGDVLEHAVASKVVRKREATQLRRFHRIRNGVQHRRRRVQLSTAYQLIGYYLNVVNRHAYKARP